MRSFEIVSRYLNHDIKIPHRQTKTSAGYDLSCAKETKISPGEIKLVETGLKVRMQDDEVFLIFPRSSLALSKGLTMSNNVGVIDSDYYGIGNNEGHILVPIINHSKEIQVLEKHERFAQGIFINYLTTDEKEEQTKRQGGFGSTGV